MKIIFVCLGNICRSPMAEYIFKYITNNKYEICSRGISNEEYSNDIYYKAKEILDKNNIPYTKHFASKISLNEYKEADYIIVMEHYQIERLYTMYGKRKNVISLQDYDIEDPWYTGNFDKVYNQIYNGLTKLNKKINVDI